MSPLQKMRQDKERKDRDKSGKLKPGVIIRPGKSTPALQRKAMSRLNNDVSEISRSMTPMKNKFAGRPIDGKKYDAYKKFAKKNNIDDSTVRMICDDPNGMESKRMMKNKKIAQAVDMYKAAHQKESVEEKFKKGQTVKPTKGPHKGVDHVIIHDFGDGNYNIKPKNMPASRIRYRLGAAKANKKDLQENSTMNEKLKVSDGMGAWISDFQGSDAPQFKGKSDKERKEMAVAAYLSAKNGKSEEVDEKKITLTTKMKQRAFDRANKTAKPKSMVSLKKPPFKIPAKGKGYGEDLDKDDTGTVKKIIKGLKGAVKAHTAQAKSLEKDIKDGYVSMDQQRAVWATRKDGGKGHPDNKKKSKK